MDFLDEDDVEQLFRETPPRKRAREAATANDETIYLGERKYNPLLPDKFLIKHLTDEEQRALINEDLPMDNFEQYNLYSDILKKQYLVVFALLEQDMEINDKNNAFKEALIKEYSTIVDFKGPYEGDEFDKHADQMINFNITLNKIIDSHSHNQSYGGGTKRRGKKRCYGKMNNNQSQRVKKSRTSSSSTRRRGSQSRRFLRRRRGSRLRRWSA